jgi:ferredoxin
VKRAIVIGTGAGGAVAARGLAGAMDVTILEAGSEFRPFSGNLDRVERLRSTRLLRDPRMIRLLFPAMNVSMAADHMALVRGVCTGGTTVLATGNALRCDKDLLQRGIDLGEEFRALEEELAPSTAHQRRWRPVTKNLYSACRRLGLQPAVTPKLVDYSRCDRCGRCVLGCPSGAKWDSRQVLQQALDGGAQLETGAFVERVVVEDVGTGSARATGVVVRRGVRRRFMPADLVVLAAGGLGTGAVLARSNLRIEDHLFVDPVLCVAAPSEGGFADSDIPMPFYLEGDGYIISPYFDYLSFFFDPAWKAPRHDIAALMIKLADSESGTVGPRRVTKVLTAADRKRLAVATEQCVEILAAAGLGRDRTFLGTLNAGHPGGILPLTGTERLPLHADHLPENLYVADASLLPRSLGKPPILTIMALAERVAKLCRERFG